MPTGLRRAAQTSNIGHLLWSGLLDEVEAAAIAERRRALWTFASVKGVEPTNNHAERALRGAVIYRKLSLGSQSEGGEQRIERLLSASVTCRLQRRSLFEYLSELLVAHARGDPVPSLA